MAKCHRNDDVLLHRSTGSSSFRLWSAASFRRKIIHTMRCGGGGGCGTAATSSVEKPKQEECSRFELNKKGGSERLSELLRLSESSSSNEKEEEEEEEVKKKVKVLEEMKRVVKRLQSSDDVLWGAKEVRRLTKESLGARRTFALLGAIPTLMSLLDSEDIDSQIASLYALLNLGIGNDANKAAIVKAGAVHKMLRLIEPPNGLPTQTVAEAIVANFLGLSALDLNKPIIGSSGAIPFLVKTLKDLDNSSSSQAKQDSLRALYNLSISPLNISPMLDTGVVPFFFTTLGDMEVSGRILSILGNIVSTPEGRKAVSNVPNVYPILIDSLNWTDSPGCQEKASYILMVMAHKSYGDRLAMTEASIASALLELTLIGTTLSQKRASRILECLRVDKGKQISESSVGGFGGTLSAPLCGSSSSSANPRECLEEVGTMSEEKKAVKHLVQQSLQNNMRRIVKRANLPQHFVPSDHFKSLTSSSTSRSLPF